MLSLQIKWVNADMSMMKRERNPQTITMVFFWFNVDSEKGSTISLVVGPFFFYSNESWHETETRNVRPIYLNQWNFFTPEHSHAKAPRAIQPFLHPGWVQNLILLSCGISACGFTVSLGNDLPQAVLVLRKPDGLESSSQLMITWRVFLYDAISSSSTDEKSTSGTLIAFFLVGSSVRSEADESLDELLDDDSDCNETSGSGKMRTWLGSPKEKKSHWYSTASFLKDSNTTWGSWRGSCPPLERGVCGRQPSWIFWMMVSCTKMEPSMSSRLYSLVDFNGSLWCPCNLLDSGSSFNWEAQDKNVDFKPWMV